MSNRVKNPLPRWRGFNLMEMFWAVDSSKSARFPSANQPFQESDFQWISDWGFDFVRLPMSYRCWSSPDRWMDIDESILGRVDNAVELGRRYNIHVSLNLHRAPGYCVNPPPEPRSLWRDNEALEACCHHWRVLAKRYAGISSGQLSFDLLNEPPAPSDGMTRKEHERVIRALTASIREVDATRQIIMDGLCDGNEPVPELVDLGIAQSCRAYLPMAISHYKAPWAGGEKFNMPRWPMEEQQSQPWDRTSLEEHYGRWAQLIAQGVGVHCGEGGCFRATPHEIYLAWFRDVLEVLHDLGIGYAMWNFRGTFGILDSGRSDAAYEDWHGHSLDRDLLKLLQEH